MTATETPAVRQEGEALTHGRLAFEEEMRLPGATLDNVVDVDVIGAYGLEYDGPRCGVDGCRTPVENDDELCDDCAEAEGEPHPYPCPTCGGNGCAACGDTGERIEYAR